MIFKDKLCQKVLDGTKTQTRRLVKAGDFMVDFPMPCVFSGAKGNRLRFRENQTYAVQPGRGKHAVGRIGITKIRREQLQEITLDDMRAEGVASYMFAKGVLSDNPPDVRWKFADLWNSIHPEGKRWKDNPEVWVLEFELIS